MAEVLVEYSDPVVAPDGTEYIARAIGAEADNGNWHGWLEFIPMSGGEALRSPRETTQPNLTDTSYWATGLTPVYLEGALHRALHPLTKVPPQPARQPLFDEPAPDIAADPGYTDSILNPFSVYVKGEALLRRQLAAFSVWHLVNIIRDYRLSDWPASTLNALPAPELIELIVSTVKVRTDVVPR